jgi:hypothetical protein
MSKQDNHLQKLKYSSNPLIHQKITIRLMQEFQLLHKKVDMMMIDNSNLRFIFRSPDVTHELLKRKVLEVIQNQK